MLIHKQMSCNINSISYSLKGPLEDYNAEFFCLVVRFTLGDKVRQ